MKTTPDISEAIFRLEYEKLLNSLPHHKQAVVLTLPMGREALELAQKAVEATETRVSPPLQLRGAG